MDNIWILGVLCLRKLNLITQPAKWRGILTSIMAIRMTMTTIMMMATTTSIKPGLIAPVAMSMEVMVGIHMPAWG